MESADNLTEKETALFIMYQGIADRISLKFNEFVEAIKDWEVIPLKLNNSIIGGVMVKDNEIHVSMKSPKSSVRGLIKQTLAKVIEQHGYAVTKVDSKNSKGLRFCERLGFVKLHEQGGITLMKCERGNYD